MSQQIELHIEELVLHSHEHVDAHRLRVAVERELIRLLQADSHINPSSALRLTPLPVQMTSGAAEEALGASIAEALVGALSGGGVST